MDWQFVNSGPAPGALNMALDVALAQQLLSGSGSNVVRVYGWSPPAISLGWNQSEEALDSSRVHRAGIDIVRRPTGGRAILHSDELTYAVIMVSPGKNVLDVYSKISMALVEGLRSLGADVHLERSQPHFPSEYRKHSSLACFTSSARHEITVAGRKLVGSAQRRYACSDGLEVVLQHGSVLLGPDHRRIVEFVTGATPEVQTEVERELRLHTTDLEEVTGRRVSYEETAQAIRRGFERSWGITFADPPRTPAGRSSSMEKRVHE